MYRSVIVVEDADALRQVISLNLRRRGCRVREATTADEAIRELQAERPDLLLLDICLPDRSGCDVLREARRQGIEVPTIVVSAVRVEPARLAEFHPLAYLPKPFPLDSLLRLVISMDSSMDSPPVADGDDLAINRAGRLSSSEDRSATRLDSRESGTARRPRIEAAG